MNQKLHYNNIIIASYTLMMTTSATGCYCDEKGDCNRLNRDDMSLDSGFKFDGS